MLETFAMYRDMLVWHMVVNAWCNVLTTELLRVELAPEEHQLYSDVCEYKHPIQTDLKLGPYFRRLR